MRNILAMLLVLGLSVVLGPTARANSVTCRTGIGCLNGTDFYDWTANYGQYGSAIPNNSTATSNGGVTTTVNFSGGGAGLRADQTDAGGGGGNFFGNFARGDELLWTNGNGPLNFLNFSQSLSGIGANIQPDGYPDFTAQIQAFDASSSLIESFSENGTSNQNANGSAIFIGLNNDPGIVSVTFSLTSVTSGNPNDFVINQLDIIPGGTTPEPSSLLLLGTGLVGLWPLGRRSIRSVSE
jgi:hypothetical protein